MLDLKIGSEFKHDRRRCIKRGYDMSMLSAVVNILRVPEALPPRNRAHDLTGNWMGYQEWLKKYKI